MVLVSCTHDALAVAGVVVGSRAGGAFAVGGAVFAVGKGGAGLAVLGGRVVVIGREADVASGVILADLAVGLALLTDIVVLEGAMVGIVAIHALSARVDLGAVLAVGDVAGVADSSVPEVVDFAGIALLAVLAGETVSPAGCADPLVQVVGLLALSADDSVLAAGDAVGVAVVAGKTLPLHYVPIVP